MLDQDQNMTPKFYAICDNQDQKDFMVLFKGYKAYTGLEAKQTKMKFIFQ
jgi:hypothetical protein